MGSLRSLSALVFVGFSVQHRRVLLSYLGSEHAREEVRHQAELCHEDCYWLRKINANRVPSSAKRNNAYHHSDVNWLLKTLPIKSRGILRISCTKC